MRRIGYVLSLLALASMCLANTASAGCPYSYYPSYYPTYYTPTYYEAPKVEVKKITVLEFVQPYFVGVPATYVAPAAATAPAPTASTVLPCDEKINALKAELAAFKAQMSRDLIPLPGKYDERTGKRLPEGEVIERWPDGSPKKELVPAPMSPVTDSPKLGAAFGEKSVIGNECAKCHDSGVSASMGKGVVLTSEGKYVSFTPELIGKAMKYVTSGKCPKGKPLAQERFNAFAQELFDLASK